MKTTPDPSWTVYSLPVRIILQAVEGFGIPQNRLLEATGLKQSHIAADDAQIPVADFHELYEKAALMTGCQDIGVYAGRLSWLSGMNLQIYMSTICHTFRDYLIRIPSAMKMWGDLGEIRIVPSGDDQIRLVWRPLWQDSKASRYFSDMALATSAAIVNSLCTLPVPVLRAGFSYPEPADTGFLTSVFGENLAFETGESFLCFDRAALDYPLAQQHYDRQQGAGFPFSDFFDGKDPGDKLWSRLRQSVVRRLPDGTVTLPAIAADMNVSVRTLQRELAARGTGFRAELNDIRSRLAGRYLEDRNLSVTEVAFLLGYSNQASFSLAFRSWVGCSPGEWRKKL